MDKDQIFIKDLLDMKKMRLEQLKRDRESFLSGNEAAQDVIRDDVSILERQLAIVKRANVQDELPK